MLYLCAASVGVMSYYMSDRKYRMAFLEAHQSLEVKLTLEEQSAQQVCHSFQYRDRNTLCLPICECLTTLAVPWLIRDMVVFT